MIRPSFRASRPGPPILGSWCAVWLLLAALLPGWTSTCLAQSTTQQWQAKAVLKYPDLGISHSPLNQRFVAAVAEKRKTNPTFFADPRWPLLLADELAPKPVVTAATSPPAPPGIQAPVETPPPAAASTAEYDASPLPKAAGLTSAKFRWWSPAGIPVRGVLVLLAGRNGDSRGMVNQSEWQALAAQVHFGLMGSQLVNPPEDTGTFQGDPNGLISDLINKAVSALLTQTGQKVKDPPLAFWGHSAGGNVTQQYMSRHASRVVAAVLMRATAGPGGLAPGKDDVPTLICVGGKDKPEWVKDALANYEKGHSMRAAWTLALNSNEGHEVGHSQALALAHLRTAINLRMPASSSAGMFASGNDGAGSLQRVDKQSGWLGDPTTHEVAEAGKYVGKKQDAVWLLNEATARAWQDYLRTP